MSATINDGRHRWPLFIATRFWGDGTETAQLFIDENEARDYAESEPRTADCDPRGGDHGVAHGGIELHHLGLNNDGSPKHSLYRPDSTEMALWASAR